MAAIMKLDCKLALRQRVIATAIVFFKRFYLKISYCETDPFLVIAASHPRQRNVQSPSKSLPPKPGHAPAMTTTTSNARHLPDSNSREMEFFLVDDLECDLTVFHPYRTLAALCKPHSSGGVATTGSLGPDTETEEREAVEVDSLGVSGGAGQLELPEGGFQHAWFIITCAFYILRISSRSLQSISPSSSTLFKQRNHASTARPPLDPPQPFHHPSNIIKNTTPRDMILTFLASINVFLPLVSTIMQEIISLWSLWDRYKEDAANASSSSSSGTNGGHHQISTTWQNAAPTLTR